MVTSQLNRLALGTAQIGLDYGVSNRRGKVPLDEVVRILKTVRDEGVCTIDTAAAYGESETLLGQLGVRDLQVVTKVAASKPSAAQPEDWLVESVKRSLHRLNASKVHAVLMHDVEALAGPSGVKNLAALVSVRELGLAEKIGVSIYHPNDIERLPRGWMPDIVQVPLNVLDQRVISMGLVDRLYNAGCEVYARSVFLQGLLLMSPDQRPEYFSQWSDVLCQYDNAMTKSGMTALEYCLSFVTAIGNISKIVVGVESHAQLTQVINAFRLIPNSRTNTKALASEDPRLIEPRRWVIP